MFPWTHSDSQVLGAVGTATGHLSAAPLLHPGHPALAGPHQEHLTFAPPHRPLSGVPAHGPSPGRGAYLLLLWPHGRLAAWPPRLVASCPLCWLADGLWPQLGGSGLGAVSSSCRPLPPPKTAGSRCPMRAWVDGRRCVGGSHCPRPWRTCSPTAVGGAGELPVGPQDGATGGSRPLRGGKASDQPEALCEQIHGPATPPVSSRGRQLPTAWDPCCLPEPV